MPRIFYTLLLLLVLPFVPLRLLWRSMRQPEYLQHLGERFGIFQAKPDRPVIWLHCVSVGETRAAEPLVRQLQQTYPENSILLTHATPTGRAAGEQLFGDSVMRAYLPYDLPFFVRPFLQHFKPEIGLLMETELWFNLIHACRDQHVPLLLVNARLSDRSARGYARLGHLVEQGLCELTVIAAQTRPDAERLCELGAPQVEVTGNLKFDVSPPDTAVQQGAFLREMMGADRPVVLAASTREGEELLILDALAQIQIPGLLAVIVPRHPQRFEEVASILAQRGVPYRRRSGNSSLPPECQVLLGDSMGEMHAYYAACDLAIIGGSLLPYGGQNLIEACALGKPVLVGQHTFNFDEAASQAVMLGAAGRIWELSGLARDIEGLMKDPDARKKMGEAGLAFAAANRGAAQRLMAVIERVLHPKPNKRGR